MSYTKKINKNYVCNNCGGKRHDSKKCTEPVISLGIILFKLNIKNFNFIDCIDKNIMTIPMNCIRAKDSKDVELFSKINNNILFLMIRRKHTVGYIEFIRGKYKYDNIDGIIFLFQQMTQEEIQKIRDAYNSTDSDRKIKSFEDLWNDFWGEHDNKKYEQDYQKSKENFNKLKNNTQLGLDFFASNIKPSFHEAEWGFPKGRRNRNETDIDCAKREFQEETGLLPEDYCVLKNINPLVEDFIGTNGIKYRHIYYIAISTSNKLVNIETETQELEIGAIDYFNYYDALKLIRPHHICRKETLTKLYNFIQNSIITYVNK